MSNQAVVSEGSSPCCGRSISVLRPQGPRRRPRVLQCGCFVVLMLLPGCAAETLFQSNFDPTPINQPPAHAQNVGTADVDGPAGSVMVVMAPVGASGKWVRISRPNPQAPVAGLKGNLSAFRGDGKYTFSTILFMPSGSGLATIQFEPLGQSAGTLTNFLHIDFMQDNTLRIDDNDSTKFGSVSRDQAFIVQVTLTISASSATAHIVLAGATASGTADYTVIPAFLPMARQFGAVREWMGFPWTGSFDATDIVVTHPTD